MIVIDSGANSPIYIQVYQQLRDKIISGDLEAGEKMPSTRKLSRDLNVSRNTIDLAYHQLHSEGYIISKPRSGYFVEKLDFSPIAQNAEHGQEARQGPSLNTETSQIQYDFKYGMLNPDKLPIRQWQRLMNKSIRSEEEKMSFYGPMFGEPDLREEIRKYLKYYRGVECTTDQLFIGAGVHYCLGMLCQLLKAETAAIAMEDPGYHVTRSTIKNHGFAVESISLDEDGIDVEHLKTKDVGAVYVTPSHQYPLGIIMPISRRLELIEWANQKDSIIIEDDYSCHLRYNTKPVQSLQSLASDKVVYIGSFSKFLFPTLRVAYMVLPKDILSKFQNAFEGYPTSVPFLIQSTLALFMKEGHWESYLRKNRKLQKGKHDHLVDELQKNFGDTISIYGMHAGLHLVIEVKNGLSEQALISRAQEHGVKVYPTKKFWNNPDERKFGSVVLGFGGIAPESIGPAVKRLVQAWMMDGSN